MRIGDAAAAAGATPRALRFYEQRGLLPAPARSASGQRVYGPDDVARVRAIRELVSLGLTLEDIRGFVSRLELLTEDPELRCSAAAAASDSPAEPPAAAGAPTGSPAWAAVVRRLGALDAEIDRLTRLRDRLARAAGVQGAGDADHALADEALSEQPGDDGAVRRVDAQALGTGAGAGACCRCVRCRTS